LERIITNSIGEAEQTQCSAYDLAGNLKQLETANLLKEALAIGYAYDFERLSEITYPQILRTM
jgi:hypothetical protein